MIKILTISNISVTCDIFVNDTSFLPVLIYTEQSTWTKNDVMEDDCYCYCYVSVSIIDPLMLTMNIQFLKFNILLFDYVNTIIPFLHH